MKITLKVTGLEYRLILEAVGSALQEAKELRAKLDRNSVSYQNADFKVQKLAKLYSDF